MTELRTHLGSGGSIGSQPPFYVAERIAARFGFSLHDWPSVPELHRRMYLDIWNAEQLAARDRVKHGDTLARFAGR